MELNRKICLDIFKWCKKKYGLSEFQDDFPTFKFRQMVSQRLMKELQNEGYNRIYGEYYIEDNYIIIYLEHHLLHSDPLMCLVFTILHEYRHYLQNMYNYDMYVNKYYFSYQNHPYEKTCNNFAGKAQYECYYHILKKYNLTPGLTL